MPNSKKINLSINLLAETAFLATSLLYYYRIYKRCEAFKTPIIPGNKLFPMAASNRVLAYDCTASTSDSVILILKSVAFALKITIKATIEKCSAYCDKQNNSDDYTALSDQLVVTHKRIKPAYLTEYPRQIYQALLLIDIPIFIILTFSSWLPTYNQFNASNKNCPNFYTTCWNSLQPNSTLNIDCNTEMYKWQKFSWAAEFLFMVVVTFVIYQIFKIAHDLNKLCRKASTTNACQKNKMLWNKAEAKLALPACMFLFSESIAISHLLIVSSRKFPGGITDLVKDYFTTAFIKLDEHGHMDSKFTSFTIDMTKLDQKIFYGLLAAQIFVVPFSLTMYLITKNRINKEEIGNLTGNIGNYLRLWIEILATAAPIITLIIFFTAAGIANSKDTCFLDNFFHSLFNIFNEKSQIILSGSKKSCNLYSVSAYQGSAILQTAILIEVGLAFPTAFFSIITMLDICSRTKKTNNYNLLRKLSFMHKPKPIDATSSDIDQTVNSDAALLSIGNI